MKKIIAVACVVLVGILGIMPCNQVLAKENVLETNATELYETEKQYAESVNSVMPRTQYYVVVTSGNLNVRDYPVTGNIIATLPNGTVVDAPTVQEGWIPDGWVYIASPVKGYVAEKYLVYGGTP